MISTYKNHSSQLKQRTREELLRKAEKIYSRSGKIKALTLPSSNFIFEQMLIDAFPKRYHLDCVERDHKVFQEIVDKVISKAEYLSHVNVYHDDVFNFLEETEEKYNFVWLDLCGNLSQSNIMDFLQFIQSGKLMKEAQVCVTTLGAREFRAGEIEQFYDCDLKEFRTSTFPSLVKEFAKQAGKNCVVQPIIQYKSELITPASPMNVYSFLLTNKQK